MAERRMFAKTIIDSDAFLDMPLTTQALYFHLAMRADDDGFINNPKKIMRMVGATDDELKILIAKKFILSFESGIIVIKHWRIHNYIQKDRYKATVYQEEASKIKIKDNSVYTLDTECIQDVYTGKVRIGKVRIGKVSLDKNRIELEGADENIKDYWNSFKNLLSVRTLSKKRITAIKNRLKELSIEEIKEAIKKISENEFCTGNNDRNWKADFDWLFSNDTNILKVLEGKYDNNKNKPKEFKSTARQMLEEMEAEEMKTVNE